MSIYESGRDLMHFGITPLSNMISETALVKAMWALGTDEKNIEQIMLKNIASEFTE
jgi:glutamyl-tRNA(Gln) amidotransferase subunit D